MSWTWANPAMLLGLASLAIPLVIHFLNRRRNVVVDWGAMQFLEAGARSRQRVRLTDALLMAARMLVLGLVVLALARPALGPGKESAAAAAVGAGGGFDQGPRDVVLVIDGSASMGRRGDGSGTAFDQAREWSRRFVERLSPGSAVGLVLGRERVIRVVEPLSRDRQRVLEAIEKLPAPAGSSDLATAAAEALELLEKGEQGRRDVVVLSDGQALPWRKDEGGRWQLLRALYQAQGERTGVKPRVWALGFDPGMGEGADGAVGAIEVPRGLVPPGLTIDVKAAVRNGGPGELLRRAELFVDGQARGEAQAVGPLPAGSATTVAFRVKLEEPGSHLLSIRLDEESDDVDPLRANDRAERPIEVTAAVPVLLVDGDRGLEPLSSETDFLRAALAPTQDDAPRVLARVIDSSELDVASITNQKVLVLANVGRLSASGLEAVSRILDAGGGVLVAPGDRVEARAVNEAWFREGSGWLPASLGEWRGDLSERESLAHPAPSSFGQSILGAFGQGQDPALGQASLFGYWILTPVERAPGAVVLARLDTGDPWVVERAYRKGRVMLLAGPLDAEGGTLPVNPDFVPLVHELIYWLGDPATTGREARPGEPLSVEVDPDLGENLETVAVTTPGGATVQAAIERTAGRAFARLAAADEPGTYRFAIPGGLDSYATVRTDEREWESETLSASDRQRLAEGWELSFVENGEELERAMSAVGSAGRLRPLWRWLVLAGLGGLCLEIFLTRRIVLSRGVAPRDTGDDGQGVASTRGLVASSAGSAGKIKPRRTVPMKKTACLAMLVAGVVMSAMGAADAAADESTVILLIGKDQDHAPGTHEYMAECELLAKCLRQTEGIEAVVSNGWPTDPKVLSGVDAIVLYTAVGGNVLFKDPAVREQVEKKLKGGTGLVEIHWSTDAAPGEAGDKQLEYLGGWFSPSFSEIPVRDSEIKQVAKDHPISRGWADFPMKDEYYIKLKFQEAAQPLFTANIDGTDYVVGWALERPTGGRSFGTVCGHFHECFAKEPFRKAVVNGILWAAGRQVPEEGAPVAVTEADLTLPPDPREKK